MEKYLSKCPCSKGCPGRRETVVNIALKQEICTTVALKTLLMKTMGSYSATKGLKFLCSGDCKCITVHRISDEEKPTIFGRQGKLLYAKDMTEDRIRQEVNRLLTKLQTSILAKFSNLNKRVYYFSKYDLKRLVPTPGNVVDYSVDRLVKLGFIVNVTIQKTDFYLLPSQLWKLAADEQSIVIEDIVEYAVVKHTHELIMNLYPDIMLGYDDAIRPRRTETLRVTGGMTFDIFYRFRENTLDKKYLAIDVYTRYPVTGYTVNSFMKKIEWAKSREKGKYANHLLGNTYGMIVFRIATPAAIRKANALGIRFIRLSNIKIDYKTLVEKTKSDLLQQAINNTSW